MKLIVQLVLTLVAGAIAHPSEYYDTKLENLDITEITNNERILKSYIHCFLGKGSCTPEGNDIKKLIPDASNSKCSKCTEKQKQIVATCIKAMMNKIPDDWSALHKQTDPEGKYQKELEDFLNQYAPA